VSGVMAVLRRRRLQQRFGPEYDTVAGERDSRRKAEAELAEREHRVEDLDIQPLTDSARAARGDQPEAAAGTASTEDLRGAMVHYRALYGDPLGEPADTGSESAAAAETRE
jgi:hypothetical protein